MAVRAAIGGFIVLALQGVRANNSLWVRPPGRQQMTLCLVVGF
ncbi:MAG: hypothetical protein WCB74_10355 [Pseudolabrys sp.]